MTPKHSTHDINKYAPGPWILGGASGRMITTPSGYVGDGFIADVDTLANARLISAAPELLEALTSIISKLDEMEPTELNHRVPYTEHSRISKAKQAITKATTGGKE